MHSGRRDQVVAVSELTSVTQLRRRMHPLARGGRGTVELGKDGAPMHSGRSDRDAEASE